VSDVHLNLSTFHLLSLIYIDSNHCFINYYIITSYLFHPCFWFINIFYIILKTAIKNTIMQGNCIIRFILNKYLVLKTFIHVLKYFFQENFSHIP
jgi:hypothetical protein